MRCGVSIALVALVVGCGGPLAPQATGPSPRVTNHPPAALAGPDIPPSRDFPTQRTSDITPLRLAGPYASLDVACAKIGEGRECDHAPIDSIYPVQLAPPFLESATLRTKRAAPLEDVELPDERETHLGLRTDGGWFVARSLANTGGVHTWQVASLKMVATRAVVQYREFVDRKTQEAERGLIACGATNAGEVWCTPKVRHAHWFVFEGHPITKFVCEGTFVSGDIVRVAEWPAGTPAYVASPKAGTCPALPYFGDRVVLFP